MTKNPKYLSAYKCTVTKWNTLKKYRKIKNSRSASRTSATEASYLSHYYFSINWEMRVTKFYDLQIQVVHVFTSNRQRKAVVTNKRTCWHRNLIIRQHIRYSGATFWTCTLRYRTYSLVSKCLRNSIYIMHLSFLSSRRKEALKRMTFVHWTYLNGLKRFRQSVWSLERFRASTSIIIQVCFYSVRQDLWL